MRNFKLLIEYDGTDFHGWQRQRNERTIQEEIEKGLERILKKRVSLIGSGRTDAGVHALGQTANFKCDTHLQADVFQKALNSLVNPDIVILDCREMSLSFHARFDVKEKRYRYVIFNKPLRKAINRRYHWHVPIPLNTGSMAEAAEHLIGTYDFKSFEGTGSPRAHTVRTITTCSVSEKENGFVTIEIEANGFLRYMVRNIVGTLVEVGSGKRPPGTMEKILSARDRSKAGNTAPPNGLFLVHVRY